MVGVADFFLSNLKCGLVEGNFKNLVFKIWMLKFGIDCLSLKP